jgi:ribosomal protein S11
MVKNKTAVIAKKLHILHIIITKNNLKVSLMLDGDVVFKKSEGSLKGIRKGSINSPDTSLIMMGYVATLIRNLKIHSVGIYIRGATRWKKFSLRRFLTKLKGKVSIKFIKDITGTPHNGCFPVKKRRKRKRRHLKVKNFIQYNITKKERL